LWPFWIKITRLTVSCIFFSFILICFISCYIPFLLFLFNVYTFNSKFFCVFAFLSINSKPHIFLKFNCNKVFQVWVIFWYRTFIRSSHLAHTIMWFQIIIGENENFQHGGSFPYNGATLDIIELENEPVDFQGTVSISFRCSENKNELHEQHEEEEGVSSYFAAAELKMG